MSWDAWLDRDRIIELLGNLVAHHHKLEEAVMASQNQVRQDIATLHTTLTSAVQSIQDYQKAEGDKITQLQDQLQKLTDQLANGDVPDDIDQSVNDLNTLAQSISTQLLDPSQPPVTPTPVTPTPDQPVPVVPDQPTPVVPVDPSIDPNQPVVPPVTPVPDPNQPTPVPGPTPDQPAPVPVNPAGPPVGPDQPSPVPVNPSA